jgi:hypothetical protein
VVVLLLVFAGSAAAAGPITITDPPVCPDDATCVRENATPYPSTLTVSGAPPISTLEVRFIGFWHDVPDDLDVLLESPGGQKIVLMSDAGFNNPIDSTSPINFSFKDGGEPLPNENSTPPADTFQNNKVYAPGDYDGTPETSNDCVFLGPGDARDPAEFAGAVATLAALGPTANGNWALKISDDCGEGPPLGPAEPFGGGRLGAWCLVINNVPQGCPSTTAVTISAFAATRARAGVRVTWRTAQEMGVAGFNVYRTKGKTSVKVNKALVRAKRSGTGRRAAYALTDRTARRGVAYTYKLQIVQRNGKRSFAATAPLARR